MIDLVKPSRRSAARYGALFRVPHVRRLVLSGMLARLPAGMIGLALLLVREASWQPRAAERSVSAPTSSPSRRRSDRGAPRRPAWAADPCSRAVIFPALLACACALLLDAPPALIGAAAAAAGALTPPVGGVARALWPRMFVDAELRAAAYAREASLQEITFIVGRSSSRC